jgi:hypothetical protein
LRIAKAKKILLDNENKMENKMEQPIKTIEEFYNSSYELKPTKLEDPSEHMIQIRNDKPHLPSFPSEFFTGVINPLKKRTIKKNLNIDTRFRNNYFANSSTNFNLSLPTNFNNVVQMQLASIELPTSYYLISKHYGNNYFSISITTGILTSTTIITIPDGNYTQQTLMDMINTQLLNAGGQFQNVSFIINLTSGNTGTGQTMVGPNAGGTTITDIELNFQLDKFGMEDRNNPLPLKFGWILGFRNGKYSGSSNYVSEGIVDTTGPRYIYLVVDDYNQSVNNNFYSAFNSSILNKNIIARISLKANAFNILEQDGLNIITTPREYFGPVNINNLTIQLLDEYGRIIDLNNMDYSFCLNLTTIYDI